MTNPPKRQRISNKNIINTQTHDWSLGAIAELISQAISDTNHHDTKSTQKPIIHIDSHITQEDEPYLTIRSPGRALSHSALSSRISITNPINQWYNQGAYANPWQAAALRIGAEVIIVTKNPTSSDAKIALLSRSRVSDLPPNSLPPAPLIIDWPPKQSTCHLLTEFCTYSPFPTKDDIQPLVDSISQGGTLLILFSLRRCTENANTELDITSDMYDIRLSSTSSTPNPTITLSTFTSLRAYLELLFLRPSFQLILRGKPIRPRRISSMLTAKYQCSYDPPPKSKGNKIIKPANFSFGFDFNAHQNEFGMLIYSNGRLVVPYWKLGSQTDQNSDVRVTGIIEADFLTPTPNWQDFVRDKLYKRVIFAINRSLKLFWSKYNSFKAVKQKHSTDSVSKWTKCDDCYKWRKVSKNAPDPYDWNCIRWVCKINTGGTNKCIAPDDEEDPVVKRKRMKSSQQANNSTEVRKRPRTERINNKINYAQTKKKNENPKDTRKSQDGKATQGYVTPAEVVQTEPQLDLDGPTPELVATDGVEITTGNFSLSNSPHLPLSRFRQSEGIDLLAKAAAAEPLCSADTPQLRCPLPSPLSDAPDLQVSVSANEGNEWISSTQKTDKTTKESEDGRNLPETPSTGRKTTLSVERVRSESPSDNDHNVPTVPDNPKLYKASKVLVEGVNECTVSDTKIPRQQEPHKDRSSPALEVKGGTNSACDITKQNIPSNIIDLDGDESSLNRYQCQKDNEKSVDQQPETSKQQRNEGSALGEQDVRQTRENSVDMVGSKITSEDRGNDSRVASENQTPEPASSTVGTPLDAGMQERIPSHEVAQTTENKLKAKKESCSKSTADNGTEKDNKGTIQPEAVADGPLQEGTSLIVEPSSAEPKNSKNHICSSPPVKDDRSKDDTNEIDDQPNTATPDNTEFIYKSKGTDVKLDQKVQEPDKNIPVATNEAQDNSPRKPSIRNSSPTPRKMMSTTTGSLPTIVEQEGKQLQNVPDNHESTPFELGSPPERTNQLLAGLQDDIFTATPFQSSDIVRDPFDMTTPADMNRPQPSQGTNEILGLDFPRSSPTRTGASPSVRLHDVTLVPSLHTRETVGVAAATAITTGRPGPTSNDQNQLLGSINFQHCSTDAVTLSKEAAACATRTLLTSLPIPDPTTNPRDNRPIPGTGSNDQHLLTPHHRSTTGALENSRSTDYAGISGLSQLTLSAAVAGAAAAAVAINSNHLQQKQFGFSDLPNSGSKQSVDSTRVKELLEKLDEEKRTNDMLRSKLQEVVCLLAPGTGGGASGWLKNIEELDVRVFTKEINDKVSQRAQEAAEREQLEKIEELQANQQIACRSLEKLRQLARLYLDQVVGVYNSDDSEEPIEVQFEECLRAFGAFGRTNSNK